MPRRRDASQKVRPVLTKESAPTAQQRSGREIPPSAHSCSTRGCRLGLGKIQLTIRPTLTGPRGRNLTMMSALVRHTFIQIPPQKKSRHFHPKTGSSTDIIDQIPFHPNTVSSKFISFNLVRFSWLPLSPAPSSPDPQIFALFFLFCAPFSLFFFSLSGGLLVELWPRVAAMDHPHCAFGLLWDHFL